MTSAKYNCGDIVEFYADRFGSIIRTGAICAINYGGVLDRSKHSYDIFVGDRATPYIFVDEDDILPDGVLMYDNPPTMSLSQ